MGALSPIVLLNTLLFFGAKLLNLKTVEEHRRLAFSNVSHCSKTTKNGVTSYLRFRLPSKEEEKEKEKDKKGEGYAEDPMTTLYLNLYRAPSHVSIHLCS